MGNFIGDVRHALRQFWSARVFTVTAVLTLAIGIGGTTAIFTLVHAVMLRSLPVSDPARLYRIGDGDNCCVQGGTQDRWGMFSHPVVRAPEGRPAGVRGADGLPGRPGSRQRTPAGRRSRRRGRCNRATSTAATSRRSACRRSAGACFTTADDTAAAPPVVVMSHHAWTGTYGADPKIVGATLVLEGHPFTVVGITGPGFFGETLRGDPPDLWIPLHQEPLIAGETALLRQPVSAWLRVIGRLKPDATTDGMSARLTGILRQWLQHDSGYPANWMPGVIRELPQQSIAVVPAGGGVGIMREQYSRSLRILFGVCALVLLIACANVANLLLARAVARRGQTAVRLALGASRRQIVTQALLESVLLAVLGGIVGLAVAVATARLLLALAFAGTTFLPIDTMPSPLVLAFAFALAFITGMLFGAAPAWFATRTNPIDALRGAGRSSGDHSSFTRKALVVLQAAVSVVLVVGSLLLARSLANLENQDFGFPTAGRVLVQLNRPPANYGPEKLDALYRDVEDRVKRLPGVRGGGLALYNPFTDNWGEGVLISGQPPPQPGQATGASWDRVSATYLQDLGVKLVRGRHLDARDIERVGARRGRQRGLRPPLLQQRRRSDRPALRPQHAGARQHVSDRRRRARRTLRRLQFLSAAAPDVLRVAGAERRLRQPDDEARRDRVALHPRHPAGDRPADVDARAAADADARRRRCEPHRHQRAHPAAAGRSRLRSAARRRQPGRVCSASWR